MPTFNGVELAYCTNGCDALGTGKVEAATVDADRAHCDYLLRTSYHIGAT